jgi:DNA-binding MarR family transcriptional regulator
MSKDLQVPNPYELPAAPSTPTVAPDRNAHPGATTPIEATSTVAVPDTAPELDELERRAWRSFLTKHARLARTLEADLIARSDLPLAEFDVLFQLSVAEEQRLRMNELADRVLLSRAGITRLVDRLVADGLVMRVKCASDARGAFASLTDHGRARLEEARPVHFCAVKHYFLESLSRDELETLAELLERSIPTD